ncbi:MAG: hypothetical protein OEZ43_03660 [Gammaproteobacteria bacterium]|nr:hypothetical protein [Gammaproteobacteria bacterium]
MKSYPMFFSFLSAFLATSVIADVQVITVDETGGKSAINMNKDWAKIVDMSQSDEYMLIDMNSHVTYVVDGQNKMAIKIDADQMMPSMTSAQKAPRKPNIELRELGNGPKIAGYSTKHFVLNANGVKCSEHFITNKLSDIPEIKKFSTVMEQQAAVNHMDFGDNVCEYAESELERQFSRNGIPLRSLDASGKPFFDTVEININARFSASEFAIPSGYQVITQQELMQREMNNAMSSGDMPTQKELEQMSQQIQEQMKLLQGVLPEQ